MKILEIEPTNPITVETFLTTKAARDWLEILVVKFSGSYGVGSAGNQDARYMRAMAESALYFAEPAGIVYDLRELSYQWGDMMGYALSAGEDRFDAEFPSSIVVSEKCEEAIISLIKEDWMRGDLSFVHRNLDDAINYIYDTCRP